MSKFILALLFSIPPVILQAQDVPFITRTQIVQWKSTPSDTVYVLNFWATWCAPCVKELPDFDLIQEKYAGQKVKIFLISADFKRDVDRVLKPYIRRKKITSQVVFMNEGNPNNYIDLVSPEWSGALPATLIVCKNKNFEHFHEGESILKRLTR